MFGLNIETHTIRNSNYRKVLYTDKFQQLVLMSLKPGETIPLESHNGTQFIRIEHGTGIAKVISQESKKQTKQESKKYMKKNIRLKDGVAIVIPPKTKHVVSNTGTKPLKLYAIYSPPEHKKELVQKNFSC